MRITNIIIATLAIISLAAFCCFIFYPYSELPSMEAKADHAMNCLYAMIACVIGLAVTAYIAAKR